LRRRQRLYALCGLLGLISRLFTGALLAVG
jgi:hypothetical protein